MLCGEISQTKRGSLRGDPWRSCVITLKEGNPSLWIRGVRWREKGKESKEKKEKGKKGQKGKREVIFLVFGLVYEGEQKRERGVRSSTFSLRFTEIGPSIFVGARGKVYLRDESFA